MRGGRRPAAGRCPLLRGRWIALAWGLSQLGVEGGLGPAGLGLCWEPRQWSMWRQGRTRAWVASKGTGLAVWPRPFLSRL